MKRALDISGKSGFNYRFYIYRWPCTFEVKQGAIFLFIKLLYNDFYVPLFLGITDDLREYCKHSVRAFNIRESIITHVCICVEEDEIKRNIAEEDLSIIAEKLMPEVTTASKLDGKVHVCTT